MSIKPLVQLRGAIDRSLDDKLRKACSPIEAVTDDVRALIADLRDTLAAHRIAVGLAAPQIGSELRVAVVDLKTSPGSEPLVLVNPVILTTSGKKDVKKESCMSVPGLRGPVVRREKIRLRFMTEDGTVKEMDAHGYLSRVIQHEVDHLDGVLYVDRMDSEGKLERVDFFDEK